jgi:hypothetical protein
MNAREPASPELRQFEGMFSDVDPRDVPEGKLLFQLNLVSEVNGQLTTRGGLRRVELETLE